MPRATLAAVVGQNCKRIRNQIGITQDELARYARDRGLRWRASTVADFEGARSAPTFATVLALSITLQDAVQVSDAAAVRSGKRPISMDVAVLDQLVQFDGEIEVNDDLALSADVVIGICRSQARPGMMWTPPGSEPEGTIQFYRDAWGDSSLTPIERVLLRSGSAEDRLARQLGIERHRLAELSNLLWQSTFSEERDRRAGLGANQQKKGRITREMRAELERELPDVDD